ncbi:hypothetical protein K469DRAFT_753141 [Zopfia rhizophila CBS 207.26]|uniref:Uncharacterized protein n=1 Tax=Zopfia rhizophila CBS 207.26 TaxID=1314779 RepID=A0A6A6DP46_9PEZI|nr:hypothetical protein K469DRAFT_753141 [Zopfia rhizophila CBS 207.26]
MALAMRRMLASCNRYFLVVHEIPVISTIISLSRNLISRPFPLYEAMRSLFALLDADNDEPFLSYTRTRIKEEEFISLGKTFLSALAVAEPEDLEEICSKLLPHKLSFDRTLDPPTPAWKISQATRGEPLSPPDFAEDLQLSEAFFAESSPPSHPTGPAPQPTIAETPSDRDLFAAYTTLEDLFPIHGTAEQGASVHSETQDHTEVPTESRSTPPESHIPKPPGFQNMSGVPNITRNTVGGSNVGNRLSILALSSTVPY